MQELTEFRIVTNGKSFAVEWLRHRFILKPKWERCFNVYDTPYGATTSPLLFASERDAQDFIDEKHAEKMQAIEDAKPFYPIIEPSPDYKYTHSHGTR